MQRERSIQARAPRELDERELSGVMGGSGESGLVGPDGDVNDFPPWVRPRIRIIDLAVNPAILQKAVIR